MRRIIPLLVLPFLVSCAGPKEEVVTEPKWPVYCIRDAIFLDDDPNGRVLLDMPGYPYGMTDKIQEIDRQTYNELDVDTCKSDDPRMQVKPSGIAWTDGRNTDLDGKPLE